MDLAQSLVRSCVRAFYETKLVLVIDALILHSALRDDDLAYLMGLNTKEVHKLCGALREARFLAVHTRAEQKEGQQRPMNRTYYYIDYRASIDAIKWKVYQMNLTVQGNTVPAAERKEYFCTRCKSEWTTMEVLDGWCAEGFQCHKCGWILTVNTENNHGGHEQSTKYHAQFRFITDLLPKIDEVIIPENTFDKALANQKKVVREETNPANETVPIDSSSLKPTAVRGMSNIGPTSIAITLTTSEGPTEAEALAEQARKERTAAQNAMPVHFTHSTITGEQVRGLNQATGLPARPADFDNKKTSVDTSMNDDDDFDGADYFQRLKAETAREAAREQEEEYETDDEEEDEDGFEDVPTNVGTPASSSALPNGLTGVLKKGASASGSGTSTGVNSPVTGPGTPAEDGRPAKKLRIEEPVAKEEDESEEDMAFEDV